MISKDISKSVLSIGCAFNPPRGGVAQVMYTYSQEVYPFYHYVTNSGEGGMFLKICQVIVGVVKVIFILLFYRRIRIVHIHTSSYISFKRSSIFLQISRFFRKRVVLHMHGGSFKEYYKTNPIWIKKILLKADYVVALTNNWNNFYSNTVGLTKVVTIPNIVPNPRIKIIPHDGRIHLLFLGFIIDQKGIFDLVEVINSHKEEWRDKIALHVGGNHDVQRLQRFIKVNKLSDLIIYEGWVSGDKKIDLLNLMDVFILPSYVEGLPISILESLSYGKPVITTPVGGIPEVVNNDNGYLLSPGDRQAIYEIIREIVSNPKSLQNKGKVAKASAASYFPDRISEKLENMYKEILNDVHE